MEAQTESVNALYDQFVEIISLSEKENFPVDFDVAWEWVGYNKKQNAVELLEKNFVEGVEFLLLGVKTPGEKGGRPAHNYKLTVDCFKAFCMLAQTERGREVRLYYIQLEKDVHILGMAGAYQKHYNSDLRRELVKELKSMKEDSARLKEVLDTDENFDKWFKLQNRIVLTERKLKKMTKEVMTQFNAF